MLFQPENILLTDDMHIQLTDFGSSLIVESTPVAPTDDNPTSDGEKKPVQRKNSFVGTAQFVAPEILQRGPVHYGFVRIFLLFKTKPKIPFLSRSDLWSLGCIIYQMVTGKHLFRGKYVFILWRKNR